MKLLHNGSDLSTLKKKKMDIGFLFTFTKFLVRNQSPEILESDPLINV